jgi:hypothetical protein
VEFISGERPFELLLHDPMGGVGGTYAELLTCLEMARDVRKLPKESTTTGMGGTTDRRSRPR